MLCAVKRNMAFVDGFLEKGGFLEDRDMELLATIRRLYAQQKEMFDEKKHRVAERIVSVTQPYVRPIVRGKVKDPVESGAKYDVSVEKRCCGAGIIMTKLSKTTLGSIALSVLVANLFRVRLPRLFFCSISWTRPMVCRRVICWKSRTRRHDGLGRRHPQATHGRRAARNPAPAAGSRLLWGCNEIFMQSQRGLAAESAKAHAAHSTCLRSLTR